MRPTVASSRAEAFFRSFPRKSYDKKQIMTHAGDEPSGVFYLTSGKVRQYDINTRGDEIVVNIFKPGSFFSMTWALADIPNTYFYAAVEPTEVHVAPKKDAIAFVKANNDVMFDLLRRMSSGLEGIQRRTSHLMGGTARSRLVFELVLECSRFGNIDNDTCEIYTNEGEFAERTGLSRETVNREMMKLKAEGYVSRKGKVIVVESVIRLKDLLSISL